jgi:hypothetical protein
VPSSLNNGAKLSEQSTADSLDLHGMTRVMNTWRRLLRPGGHLIVALTARGPEPGAVSHRSTVIAAARAAGLPALAPDSSHILEQLGASPTTTGPRTRRPWAVPGSVAPHRTNARQPRSADSPPRRTWSSPGVCGGFRGDSNRIDKR